MKGFFTAEEAKHLTDEEYLSYWSAGLAPPPTIEVIDRWLGMMQNQLDDQITTELCDMQDRIDELLEENERLTRESCKT